MSKRTIRIPDEGGWRSGRSDDGAGAGLRSAALQPAEVQACSS